MAATLGVDTIQHTNGTTAVTVGTNGSVTAAGTLGVTGASTLTGNTTVGGTLGVTGVTTLTGNVGIGTTSPAEKLDVSGNIRLSGSDTYIKFINPGGYDFSIRANSGNNLEFYSPEYSANPLMAITNNGNVGIGTSSPSNGKLVVESNGSNIYLKQTTGDYGHVIGQNDADGALTFSRRDGGNTERMRIDSSGKLLIGTTAVLSFASSAPIQVLSSGIAGAFKSTSAGSQTISVYNTGDSGTRYLMWFESNASRTNVGSITSNGSATAYNTSSDYRLKENVVADWDATTRLKQLNPVRFNFIADETNTLVDGFLAHEVSSIVPEAITGTKDAMRDEEYEVTPAIAEVRDADYNITTEAVEAVMGTRSVPDMQGIDQSKLVPLLVKTIQELEARITALEA